MRTVMRYARLLLLSLFLVVAVFIQGAAFAQSTGMSVTPVLRPSQTLQLTPAFTTGAKQSLTWSVSPSLGSVSASGLYTAPATIASVQTVVVTAKGISNSMVKAGITITLQPGATISISPAQAVLSAGQTRQFTVTLNGTAAPSVNWSINPPVGNISSGGLYMAPSALVAAQTITITATSKADASVAANATITLQPAVGVTITPQAVELRASQAQQFNVSLTGTANPNVTWSLAPPVGTVVNGLYTAPASIAAPQTVTLTARSAARLPPLRFRWWRPLGLRCRRLRHRCLPTSGLNSPRRSAEPQTKQLIGR